MGKRGGSREAKFVSRKDSGQDIIVSISNVKNVINENGWQDNLEHKNFLSAYHEIKTLVDYSMSFTEHIVTPSPNLSFMSSLTAVISCHHCFGLAYTDHHSQTG